MPRPLLALSLAVILSGCLSGVEEARLERAARDVPLPAGAEPTYSTGCSGGCWSARSAFARVLVVYPGGTNVSDLRLEMETLLRADGWTILETREPHEWHDGGTGTSGATVRAQKESLFVGCYVGQRTDLRIAVRLECSLERVP